MLVIIDKRAHPEQPNHILMSLSFTTTKDHPILYLISPQRRIFPFCFFVSTKNLFILPRFFAITRYFFYPHHPLPFSKKPAAPVLSWRSGSIPKHRKVRAVKLYLYDTVSRCGRTMWVATLVLCRCQILECRLASECLAKGKHLREGEFLAPVNPVAEPRLVVSQSLCDLRFRDLASSHLSHKIL